MENNDLIVAKLREYFQKEDCVSFAFIFGSQSKGMSSKFSDWDIAVYFKDTDVSESEGIESLYPEENRVWDDLISILGTDSVDLVVLNRAPANISASALSEGVALVIKERGLFLDFMLGVMREAEDYRGFVDSYYEIFQRSSSLGTTDREKLKKIIMFMEDEFSLYEYFSLFSFRDYNEVHKRHDVERWVENIVNSAIDIGEIILASEKKKLPDTYKDVFVYVGLLSPFENLEIGKFTKWVKLRNILAHEYLDIRWERIEEFIKESKPYFELFLDDVKKCL